MITDKVVKVTTNEGDYTMVVTAKQIEETIRRRMRTLTPNARILDMHEAHEPAQQQDLLSTKTKR